MKRLKPYTACFLFLASSHFTYAIDRNGNGMCDIWEVRYGLTGIDANSDSDGDGMRNMDEATAGTDPLNSASRLGVGTITASSDVVVTTKPVAGKSYQLQSAPSPSGPWTSLGGPIITNNAADLTFPSQSKNGDKAFYRISVEDVDSDNDQVSDWAERELEGFNPQAGDSFGLGQANGDRAAAEAWLDGLAAENLVVTSTAADAYEKGNTPASFTITRSASLTQPFTVFLRRAPASSASAGLASSSDFQLKNASGSSLLDRVVIPAGQGSVDFFIHATADSFSEVPEEVRFTVGGSSAILAGRICDAAPTPNNDKLLVAYLSPRNGVSTLGSGIATVKLLGNNDSSTITVSFSNLGSVANGAHVETGNGFTIVSVPPFRYSGQTWNIRATQTFTTDQEVLNQLLSGAFLFNVQSQMQPSGEISGSFQSVNASTEFQIPAPAPAVEDLTGDALDRDIVRFLTQATFGARWEDVLAMRARVASQNGNRMAAFEEWIDEQFTLPAPSHTAMTVAGNDLEYSVNPPNNVGQKGRQDSWWTIALNSPDQLRQRMTYALSQIFVISDDEPTLKRMGASISTYYDMLQSNSFGTYRNIIEGVSLHPSMGHYLTYLRNQKAQTQNGIVVSTPDENYAREIMQLFSIGLVNLHPDGSLILGSNGLPVASYNQNDITELARVFTGWSFSKRTDTDGPVPVAVDNTNFFLGSGFERYAFRWTHPLKLFPIYHDEGAKNFLGYQIPARIEGGTQDLADTLNFLSNHPNTAPFIARLLLQRLTTSNPSSGYLYRVSKAFKDSQGNFGVTLKAILLDPEARNGSSALSAVGAGKPKENLIRHCSLLRAMGAKSSIPLAILNNFSYPSTEFLKFPQETRIARYREVGSDLAQTPVSAPSVFNWYRPDYAPSGMLSENGFSSPEFQLLSESTIMRAINYHYTPIYANNGQDTQNLPTNPDPSGVQFYPEYDTFSDNVKLDFTPLRALYLSVLDTNNDGLFSSDDSTWVNRASKVPEAMALVLDRIDLLLCAGSLKARFGDTPGKPRRIILDTLLSIRSGFNDSNNTNLQTVSMEIRIKDAIYLVIKSPDFIIQK